MHCIRCPPQTSWSRCCMWHVCWTSQHGHCVQLASRACWRRHHVRCSPRLGRVGAVGAGSSKWEWVCMGWPRAGTGGKIMCCIWHMGQPLTPKARWSTEVPFSTIFLWLYPNYPQTINQHCLIKRLQVRWALPKSSKDPLLTKNRRSWGTGGLHFLSITENTVP